MYWKFSLLFLFCYLSLVITDQSWNHDRYNEPDNSEKQMGRVIELMISYYMDAKQRILETNNMRFMYEESPYYEQGYVFGEIIERYKKMVEHLKRMVDFKNMMMYDHLDRTEMIQKHYFEINHLVNMMHEVPKKYSHKDEFKLTDDGPADQKTYAELKKAYLMEEERKRLERKAKLKELKKRNKLIEKGLMGPSPPRKPGAKPDPYNTVWPIDYGWDIPSW